MLKKVSMITLTAALLVCIGSVAGLGNVWPNPDFKLSPLVPLTHCALFGRSGQFMLEWQLSLEPKNFLEVRFTSDIQRGFSGFGFTERDFVQLVTGHPIEQFACAQHLFDNHSPFDINGNLHPNFPEVPGKYVWTNESHVAHYIMRNLTTTARHVLSQGSMLPINVTIVWSYMQSSLFNGACYMDDLNGKMEWATYEIKLNDPAFLKVNGVCKQYTQYATAHRFVPRLDHGPSGRMLDGEFHQNHRVAAVLFGGGMLLESGKKPPRFDGRVSAGDGQNGVCSNSLTELRVGWTGFSDPIGGITKFLVSFGTVEKPSLYADRIDVGTRVEWVHTVATPLAKNTSYMATVTAINYAGLQTVVASRPVRVLNNGNPIVGTVWDGLGPTDIDFQRAGSTLSARWDRWLMEERGTQDYVTRVWSDNGFDYAVGERGLAPNSVLNWVHVPTWANQITITGLPLESGKVYTVSIRSRNCAGKYTMATTDGVEIDSAPPIPGTVIIGNSTWRHQPFIFLSQRLEARWFGFKDLVSGIARYEWAMSKYHYAPDVSGNTGMVMGWIDVGLATFARNTTLWLMPHATTQLTIGTNIYVHVKAIDRIGNFVIKTSNATTIVGH